MTTIVVLPSRKYDNVSQGGETSVANVLHLIIPNSGNPTVRPQYTSISCNISTDYGYANQNVANCGITTLNMASKMLSATMFSNPFDSANFTKYITIGTPKLTIVPNGAKETQYPKEP